MFNLCFAEPKTIFAAPAKLFQKLRKLRGACETFSEPAKFFQSLRNFFRACENFVEAAKTSWRLRNFFRACENFAKPEKFSQDLRKSIFYSIEIDFVRKCADFIGFGYYSLFSKYNPRSEFKIYLESAFSYFKLKIEL